MLAPVRVSPRWHQSWNLEEACGLDSEVRSGTRDGLTDRRRTVAAFVGLADSLVGIIMAMGGRVDEEKAWTGIFNVGYAPERAIGVPGAIDATWTPGCASNGLPNASIIRAGTTRALPAGVQADDDMGDGESARTGERGRAVWRTTAVRGRS
mmetsp:Transcript_5570/g.15630  ORF Transcript_5570/g.15630 Transcript_5570/m.15630 type:complete len:152 (-) Transcript_5570:790-1245(-)